jgi:hypothetical protein
LFSTNAIHVLNCSGKQSRKSARELRWTFSAKKDILPKILLTHRNCREK